MDAQKRTEFLVAAIEFSFLEEPSVAELARMITALDKFISPSASTTSASSEADGSVAQTIKQSQA